MNIKVYTMDSFAKNKDGGNPAAIVLEADQLTENQMQQLAKQIGFSETAFVLGSDYADYRIRFFTPVEEVDLCGHATIGAFHMMAEKGFINPGTYKQETRAGILTVEITDDHLVLMDQAIPQFYEVIDQHEIAMSLNIEVEDLAQDLKPQIVSTGMRDIMVPIKDMDTIKKIVPDMDKVSEVSRKYNVIGYHLFTLETFGGTAHCRNLAPLYGIPEESACGTANGALSSYLLHHNKISSDQAKDIVMEQGYTMNKPSEILANITSRHGIIERIRIGGKAMNIRELQFEL